MPKLTIDNSLLANEFFEDARLLGIQCTHEPHKFVWMVNRAFGYQFQYQQRGEIKLKSLSREYVFPIYHCKEVHLELEHILYVNEDGGKHLLPELKHIDYLWLLKGEMEEGFVMALMKELRQFEQVLLVMELTNEKIKNKEHLVL